MDKKIPLINQTTKSIILLSFIAVILYSNSLRNDFAYDDLINITENSFIRDLKNLPGLFSPGYFSLAQEKTYRPVVTLSYFINYALSGLRVEWWHAANIAIHAFNGILAYLLLRLVLKRHGPAAGLEIFRTRGRQGKNCCFY